MIGDRGGRRHGYSGAGCTRFGIYERAVYRFYEGGKPRADGSGAEKGEGGIWARIPDVAEREEGDHDGKAHVDKSFTADGNHWRFPECHGGDGAAGDRGRAQIL